MLLVDTWFSSGLIRNRLEGSFWDVAWRSFVHGLITGREVAEPCCPSAWFSLNRGNDGMRLVSTYIRSLLLGGLGPCVLTDVAYLLQCLRNSLLLPISFSFLHFQRSRFVTLYLLVLCLPSHTMPLNLLSSNLFSLILCTFCSLLPLSDPKSASRSAFSHIYSCYFAPGCPSVLPSCFVISDNF